MDTNSAIPQIVHCQRRYDFDWLKVLATLAVFLFHCARFFDLGGWHVKNAQLSVGMQGLVNVLVQWLMPLFFVLSGASIYLALKKRSNCQFLLERCTRLLIPLCFGILVLVPPQVYIERLGDRAQGVAAWTGMPKFAGSFWQFYPHYFQGWYGFGGNFAWMGLHLWYLLVLFLFSLLLLPLFRFLNTASGQTILARFVSGCQTLGQVPGLVFLMPSVPLMVLEITLDPRTVGTQALGGWNVLSYLVWLVYGYIMVAIGQIERSLHRYGFIGLFLAISTTIVLLLGHNVPIANDPIISAMMRSLRAFNSWCWIVALLRLGNQYLSFNHPFLRYASQAAFPFYVLHQTIIVIFGFVIADWTMGILPKYLMLAVTSFAAILVGYEGLIRYFRKLGFLFGLKG
jgi:hypothetical protein